MAEEKKKQQAVFTKVEQLRPMATGVNLTVKVINSKVVAPRGPQGRQFRVAECLVGDETGMIIFAAKNDQVNLVKEGGTISLRNAKIDMYRGSMRLAVDKWGWIEVSEDASFTVNEDSNLSLIEFELVNVVLQKSETKMEME